MTTVRILQHSQHCITGASSVFIDFYVHIPGRCFRITFTRGGKEWRRYSERARPPRQDHSHCQDFDVHNLLSELPACSGVELKGSIIIFQIPGGIDTVIISLLKCACNKKQQQVTANTWIKMQYIWHLHFNMSRFDCVRVALLDDTWQKWWNGNFGRHIHDGNICCSLDTCTWFR